MSRVVRKQRDRFACALGAWLAPRVLAALPSLAAVTLVASGSVAEAMAQAPAVPAAQAPQVAHVAQAVQGVHVAQAVQGVQAATPAAGGAAVAAAAVAPELPDAVMHAVAIVSSRHVRRKGRMIAVPVERYLLGRGPDELYVEDKSSDVPVIGARDGEAWILFLFASPRGMQVLVAVHDTVVALAPDGTISRAFPPRTPESLAELVLALRACRYDRGDSARALVPSLLAERDADLRFIGLQLAAWGQKNQPLPWAGAVEAGGAHALAVLDDEQPLVRHAALELLPSVPRAVALRRLEVLLASVSAPAIRAELVAAALALLASDEVPRDASPASESAPHAGKDDGVGEAEAVRAQVMAAWPPLLERDAAAVRVALTSPDIAQQEIGARWASALVTATAGLPTRASTDALAALDAWLAARGLAPSTR